MSRYTYTANLVSQTIEALNKAFNSLEETDDKIRNAINLIESSKGADKISTDFSKITMLKEVAQKEIDVLIKEIQKKASTIEEADRAPLLNKMFNRIGTAVSKYSKDVSREFSSTNDITAHSHGFVSAMKEEQFKEAFNDAMSTYKTSETLEEQFKHIEKMIEKTISYNEHTAASTVEFCKSLTGVILSSPALSMDQQASLINKLYSLIGSKVDKDEANALITNHAFVPDNIKQKILDRINKIGNISSSDSTASSDSASLKDKFESTKAEIITTIDKITANDHPDEKNSSTIMGSGTNSSSNNSGHISHAKPVHNETNSSNVMDSGAASNSSNNSHNSHIQSSSTATNGKNNFDSNKKSGYTTTVNMTNDSTQKETPIDSYSFIGIQQNQQGQEDYTKPSLAFQQTALNLKRISSQSSSGTEHSSTDSGVYIPTAKNISNEPEFKASAVAPIAIGAVAAGLASLGTNIAVATKPEKNLKIVTEEWNENLENIEEKEEQEETEEVDLLDDEYVFADES